MSAAALQKHRHLLLIDIHAYAHLLTIEQPALSSAATPAAAHIGGQAPAAHVGQVIAQTLSHLRGGQPDRAYYEKLP